MVHPIARLVSLALLGALPAAWPGAAAGAAFAGGELIITEPLADDLYVAGRSVALNTSVDGDAVLAAGSITLAGDVTGDFMAAAGQVRVEGGVGDDLRAAGGQVIVTGFVTDNAVIAGGTVTLTPESAIAGRVWISGGDVTVAGQLGSSLKVLGGTVRIAGPVEGDVDVTGRELRVEPGALIGGNLIWRGQGEPVISEEAQIFGEILAAPPETDLAAADAGGEPGFGGPWLGRLVAALAVFLAAAGLWWLAPGAAARAGQRLREAPGRTLFTGLIALVLAPVVVILLFATVVGWLLALLVLAAYVFGLAIAALLGLVAVAEGILRRRADPGFPLAPLPGSRRLLVLAVLAAGLILLRAVPLVGGLLTFLLVLAGLGALVALVRSEPAPARS